MSLLCFCRGYYGPTIQIDPPLQGELSIDSRAPKVIILSGVAQVYLRIHVDIEDHKQAKR